MATSNSVYLQINETPPLDNVGFEVRVMDQSDFEVYVASLNSYQHLSFTDIINDTGAGSITLSLEDDFWNEKLETGVRTLDILEGNYLFECWEDGVHRFDFIGVQKKEDAVTDDEERTVTISGPGVAGALRWAQVFPPNYPKHKNTVHWTGKTPAMALFYNLLKASQSRKVITFIKNSFSRKSDSSGKRWADYDDPKEILELEYGTELLDVLNMATGQDDTDPWPIRADWHMRAGRILDVRQSYGAHLETKVIFYEGDLFEKTRDRTTENIRNYIAVRDVASAFSAVEDTKSQVRYQEREFLDMAHANIDDKKRRDKVAQTLLEMKHLEESEWTIKIPYDRPTRRPFRDFNVGDYVGVSRYKEGLPSVTEVYRVLAITIDVDEDDTTVELSLQSMFQLRLRNLERKMTKIINTPPEGSIKLPKGPDVPKTPPMPVIWDPDKGLRVDPDYSMGYGGGNRVFIMPTDPALDPNNNVGTGDFWLDTNS